jgi:hypothetical protein
MMGNVEPQWIVGVMEYWSNVRRGHGEEEGYF